MIWVISFLVVEFLAIRCLCGLCAEGKRYDEEQEATLKKFLEKKERELPRPLRVNKSILQMLLTSEHAQGMIDFYESLNMLNRGMKSIAEIKEEMGMDSFFNGNDRVYAIERDGVITYEIDEITKDIRKIL